MSERVWRGNPKLEPLLVPVDEIQTHPRNPRRGDLPLLAESLDGFGQTRPIVVQPETNYICAGNHLYRAATEILAWTHLAAIRPVLEPEEYEQYLLVDNRASDLSEYDEEAMIPLLERMRATGDLGLIGWNEGEIEDFIAGSERVSRAAEAEFRAGRDVDEGEPGGGRLFKQPAGTAGQIMLAYNADAYAEVMSNIGVLRHEYGTEGAGRTVARALAEQFRQVFDGSSS